MLFERPIDTRLCNTLRLRLCQEAGVGLTTTSSGRLKFMVTDTVEDAAEATRHLQVRQCRRILLCGLCVQPLEMRRHLQASLQGETLKELASSLENLKLLASMGVEVPLLPAHF